MVCGPISQRRFEQNWYETLKNVLVEIFIRRSKPLLSNIKHSASKYAVTKTEDIGIKSPFYI